jgi:2-polyprenyl-3-methyl-5-hydroxy-6-metoxy-1,4-benzoquinol methylase
MDYNTWNSTRVKDINTMQLRNIQYEIDAKHFMRLIHKGNILDVGCSDGLFIMKIDQFAPEKFSFTGVDVDKHAIESANVNKKYNMNFVHTPLVDYNAKETYDAIIFRGTLQFLNDSIQGTFDKIKKILKPQGKVIIYSCPNFHSFLYYLLKDKWSFFFHGTNLMFNERAIESLAKQYGFAIEELSYPYMGTPYEDREKDFEDVIEIVKNGEMRNPAFWGNIMQIVMTNKEQ